MAYQVHQMVLARDCRLALQQVGVLARVSPHVLTFVPKGHARGLQGPRTEALLTRLLVGLDMPRPKGHRRGGMAEIRRQPAGHHLMIRIAIRSELHERKACRGWAVLLTKDT